MDTNDIVKFTKEEEKKASEETSIQEESKDNDQNGEAEESEESIEDLRVIKDLRVRSKAAPQEESKEPDGQEVLYPEEDELAKIIEDEFIASGFVPSKNVDGVME